MLPVVIPTVAKESATEMDSQRSHVLIIVTTNVMMTALKKHKDISEFSRVSMIDLMDNESDFQHFSLPYYSVLEWDYNDGMVNDDFDFDHYYFNILSSQIYYHYFEYDGFIIINNINNLSYVSSYLSFIFENLQKTIVITSCSVDSKEAFSDAKQNLLSSMVIAGMINKETQSTNTSIKTNINKNNKKNNNNNKTRNNYDNGNNNNNIDIDNQLVAGTATFCEVVVVFNKKVYRGNRVTRYDPHSQDGFYSPNFKPLATFGTKITVNRKLLRGKKHLHKPCRLFKPPMYTSRPTQVTMSLIKSKLKISKYLPPNKGSIDNSSINTDDSDENENDNNNNNNNNLTTIGNNLSMNSLVPSDTELVEDDCDDMDSLRSPAASPTPIVSGIIGTDMIENNDNSQINSPSEALSSQSNIIFDENNKNDSNSNIVTYPITTNNNNNNNNNGKNGKNGKNKKHGKNGHKNKKSESVESDKIKTQVSFRRINHASARNRLANDYKTGLKKTNIHRKLNKNNDNNTNHTNNINGNNTRVTPNQTKELETQIQTQIENKQIDIEFDYNTHPLLYVRNHGWTQVFVIRFIPLTPIEFLQAMILNNCKKYKKLDKRNRIGFVFVWYGVGNANTDPKLKDIIYQATNEYNAEIAITTACHRGHVNINVYAAGNYFNNCNLLNGYDMTIEACHAKLSYLMTKGLSGEQLKTQFESNLCGEMTPMTEITGRIVHYKTRYGNTQGIDPFGNEAKEADRLQDILYLAPKVSGNIVPSISDRLNNTTNNNKMNDNSNNNNINVYNNKMGVLSSLGISSMASDKSDNEVVTTINTMNYNDSNKSHMMTFKEIEYNLEREESRSQIDHIRKLSASFGVNINNNNNNSNNNNNNESDKSSSTNNNNNNTNFIIVQPSVHSNMVSFELGGDLFDIELNAVLESVEQVPITPE